jgi:SRSO17 transposase
MLAACRTQGDPDALPPYDLTPDDVEGFLDELQTFHASFRSCFVRSEPRQHFLHYMAGQFSELERKSIEPMALHLEGGNIRGMQRFISDDVWDEPQMQRIYHGMVAHDMGDPDGVVIFDESGFVKKGQDSVGVARQYCGNVGKVENSQVGVFAAYASAKGYALVDQRLFIPESWFDADHAERRTKCRAPKDVTFRSKPELASQMLHGLRDESLLPFRYIAADSVYGNSPVFLDAMEACVGRIYMAAISSETRCWLQRPETQLHTYRYGGELHTQQVLASSSPAPQSVAALAQSLRPHMWYRRTVSQGSKGPIEYEFARKRVTICRDGLPDRTVWLVIKRSVGATPRYWYAISNAPASAPLRLFVWLSGRRWSIEQCFEESKSELGMDHYEVRTFAGWHHHMLVTILAHFFLWRLKIRLEKKITCSNRLAGAVSVGRGAAAAALDNRGEGSGGRLVAATPSSSLLLPLQTAPSDGGAEVLREEIS